MSEKNMDNNINDNLDNNTGMLNAEDLEVVTGGVRDGNRPMCACGRGYVYKDGLCRHCYDARTLA